MTLEAENLGCHTREDAKCDRFQCFPVQTRSLRGLRSQRLQSFGAISRVSRATSEVQLNLGHAPGGFTSLRSGAPRSKSDKFCSVVSAMLRRAVSVKNA